MYVGRYDMYVFYVGCEYVVWHVVYVCMYVMYVMYGMYVRMYDL